MRNDSWTRRKRQRPTMLNNDRAGARGRLRQTCESLKRRRFVAARANGCLSGYVSATTGVAQIAAELLRRPSRQCRAMCGRLRVGKSFLHGVQQWSEQPCVRPVSAVDMTAGHNALRGSGPGQMPAFDNALAEVGCPDRRIDRLCITCCSPSQPFTSRRTPDAISSRRQCDGFLIALPFGHDRPGHTSDLVGERDGGDLGWPTRHQCRDQHQFRMDDAARVGWRLSLARSSAR